jgi:hypothetical protein
LVLEVLVFVLPWEVLKLDLRPLVLQNYFLPDPILLLPKEASMLLLET